MVFPRELRENEARGEAIMRFQKWLGIAVCASVLGGALVGSGTVLRAQDEAMPRRKQTRDGAARNFVSILNALPPAGEIAFLSFPKLPESISRKSERELGGGIESLFRLMAIQWKQPKNQTVKVQSESDKTATVIVETDLTPIARPLVLVEENGSWGVDLVETYAKWNNLDKAAKEATVKALIVGFEHERETSRGASCQSNLKQIAFAMAQYAQDYDHKYPLAKSWVNVLKPYFQNEQVFKCPSVTSAQGYGYAFNSKLSTKSMAIVFSPAETVSIYETSVLKRNAYGLGENRAFRHQGGANYAFADGHVKWFASSTKPSFNLKQ